MKIADLTFKKDFTNQVLKSEIGEFSKYAKEIRSLIRKAKNTDDFIDIFLANDDFAKTQLYVQLLKTERTDKLWYAARGVLGDDCFKTFSDIGGVKIGNDEFTIIIPNAHGDGETRVAVKSFESRNAKTYNNGYFTFFTSVEGKFNIYSCDCGNETAKTINGRYGIYYYDGLVLFEEWK